MARSHVEHYRVVFEYVEQVRSGRALGKVLDVGAVPGFITAALKQNGLDVEAVDLAPERTSGIFASTGVPWHCVDVEREPLPFDDASVDLVLFNEVIEHLRVNPIYPLREIYRVLRPSGILFLSTPNITLRMRLRFLAGHDYQDDIITEFRKLETVGHMGHFRLYSRTEIQKLLGFVGFTDIRAKVHETRLGTPSWRRRLLAKAIPEEVGDHLYVLASKSCRAN